ncbi:MAG: TlpA family protein disulfide reductase [Rhodospirillaceae bacterium]
MSNESGRKTGLLFPAIGLGLIIIALVVVASRSGPKNEAPVTAAAPAAPEPKAADFVWYEPKDAPKTVFKDSADADKTLDDFAGKALVVNFWATWCAPCVKEMPTLDALQAQLGGDTFQVLTISQDREGATVARPFMEKNGWKNLALYTESGARFQRDAGIRGLPTTIIIDKAGKEVGRVEGEVQWTSPAVMEKLKSLASAP